MTYIQGCENRNAGIGHNLDFFLYLIFILQTNDIYKHLKYIHIPFKSKSIHYDKIFCIDHHSSINPYDLKLNEKIVTSIDDLLINDDKMLLMLHEHQIKISEDKMLDNIKFIMFYNNQVPSIYKLTHTYLLYDKDSINIAVHIRRGDIMLDTNVPKNQYISRYLPNTYFVDVIKQIRNIMPNVNLNIIIISEGDINQFAEFDEINDLPNIQLNFLLGNRKIETYDTKLKVIGNLIFNDILITSPSGFSCIASIYSTGLIINCNMHDKLRNGYLTSNDKCVCLSTCGDLYDKIQINKSKFLIMINNL